MQFRLLKMVQGMEGTVMFIVYFFVFASIGAGLRYFLSALSLGEFPVGSLIVNIVGSFLIGLAASGQLEKLIPWVPKLVLVIAFLGALTTFSSYALEAVRYIQGEKWGYLALCIFSHNILSISACYMGLKSFSA